MQEAADAATWGVYLALLLGPFLQEDAAVFAAAGAAAATDVSGAGAFAAVLSGLILSDTWKYWAGRFAKRWRWAAKHLGDPRVEAARQRVLARLGLALMTARFVPGTRIPLYLACGVFQAPFARFFAYMASSAALYVGLAFALTIGAGAVLGDRMRVFAPFVAIAIAASVLLVAHLTRRMRRSTN